MAFIVFLAGIGTVASLLVHLSTFFGINLQESFPVVRGLHYGVIVLYLSLVLYNWKVCEGDAKGYWKPVIDSVPSWLMVPIIVLLVYGIFNFFYVKTVLNEGGAPSVVGGQKVLCKGKTVIRELTDEEYSQHKTYSLRLVSGLWVFGYYLPFPCALYCLLRKKREEEDVDEIEDDVKRE